MHGGRRQPKKDTLRVPARDQEPVPGNIRRQVRQLQHVDKPLCVTLVRTRILNCPRLFTFCYIRAVELCVISVACGSPRLLPFTALNVQTTVVFVCFGPRGATAAAFAMNEDFSRTLENQMDIFNSPDGDQVRFQISQRVCDPKDVSSARYSQEIRG